MATQNFRLVLRCKRCQWNLIAPQSICKKCGLAPAFITKQQIDSDITYICRSCASTILQALMPRHCILCGSLAYDWWDYQENDWIAPALKLKSNIKGIWLIGEFEGDFVGTLSNSGIPNEIGLKQNYHRNYDIQISSGFLTEYTFTNHRPDLPVQSDPKPFRQEFCNSILVKDLSSELYLPANLADLVIFDWHRVSEKEFLDQDKIAGHIEGKLCACLIMKKEFEKLSSPTPELIDQNSTVTIAAIHPPESPKNPGSQALGNPTPETKDSPSTGGKINEYLNSRKQDECWLCNNIMLLLLSFFLFIYFRSDGRWSDNFWCHLVQTLLFIFVTKAICMLSEVLRSRDLDIQNLKAKKRSRNFLIGLSLFSLLVVFSNLNQRDCYSLSSLGLWELISLVCFILSAFVRDCFTKTALAILFAYVVMLTMNCSKSDCKDNQAASYSKKPSVTSQLLNAKKKVENTVVEQKANYKEREVKLLTGTNNDNKKVTTSDLVANPNLLNDCNTSVYLGELGLFDRNSFTIKETAITKLEQLSSWMANQGKTRKFVITGHADQTGERFANGMPNPLGYATNMRLSKQRANAVAGWILEHEHISPEQLIIRGVGSSEPLTTDEDPDAQKMNIRVELRANCETKNNGGH